MKVLVIVKERCFRNFHSVSRLSSSRFDLRLSESCPAETFLRELD